MPGYKPTLGGLKKAQEFLAFKGYPMPIFQMNIYDDGQQVSERWIPGKGRTIPIQEAIDKYGAACEVVNVRLTNEQGDKFIQFSDINRVGLSAGLYEAGRDWDVRLEFHKGDDKFKDFMDSRDGLTFSDLARWGKPRPSLLDQIKLSLFPKRYAVEIFK